jgi:hypothetical protein
MNTSTTQETVAKVALAVAKTEVDSDTGLRTITGTDVIVPTITAVKNCTTAMRSTVLTMDKESVQVFKLFTTVVEHNRRAEDQETAFLHLFAEMRVYSPGRATNANTRIRQHSSRLLGDLKKFKKDGLRSPNCLVARCALGSTLTQAVAKASTMAELYATNRATGSRATAASKKAAAKQKATIVNTVAKLFVAEPSKGKILAMLDNERSEWVAKFCNPKPTTSGNVAGLLHGDGGEANSEGIRMLGKRGLADVIRVIEVSARRETLRNTVEEVSEAAD